MDNNILVQNLCKQFEDFSLDNVSFKVPKGRIVGFIGENGAGKSTTINLILNELSKDSGQIQVFGIDHTIPTVKENIGVVFDECNFHDVFTAADIEKILKGIYKTWDSNLFSQYLKKFKIPTKKTIGTFSKGTEMKLSIICAMAHRPKLLILDEATTGLDPVVRDEVLDLFWEFIQDEDCSIFFLCALHAGRSGSHRGADEPSGKSHGKHGERAARRSQYSGSCRRFSGRRSQKHPGRDAGAVKPQPDSY